MHRQFRPIAASVAASRRFAAEVCADLPRDVRDAIVLMVSELATNALVHATSGFDVRIDRSVWRVQVTVSDEGAGAPILQSPDHSDPHGRGLRVVRELSDEWGTTESGGPQGKSVWFSVDLDHPGRPDAAGVPDETERSTQAGEPAGQPGGTPPARAAARPRAGSLSKQQPMARRPTAAPTAADPSRPPRFLVAPGLTAKV